MDGNCCISEFAEHKCGIVYTLDCNSIWQKILDTITLIFNWTSEGAEKNQRKLFNAYADYRIRFWHKGNGIGTKWNKGKMYKMKRTARFVAASSRLFFGTTTMKTDISRWYLLRQLQVNLKCQQYFIIWENLCNPSSRDRCAQLLSEFSIRIIWFCLS